jgi:hypothetical protein
MFCTYEQNKVTLWDFLCYLLHVGVLRRLFVDPEEGGDMFI